MVNKIITDTKLCLLSELAYRDKSFIENQLSAWFNYRLKEVHHIYIKRTDTEGFACVIGEELVMVGTGTDSLKDLAIDALAIISPFELNGKKVRLHKGFQKVHDDLEDEVHKIILNPKIYNMLYGGDIKRITYTGHSLGAFVAQSIAIHTLLYGCTQRIPKKLVTFGTPGGWNKAGSKEFDKMFPDFKRYENEYDIITKIPIFSSWAGKAIKLKGKKGHNQSKYVHNMQLINKTKV